MASEESDDEPLAVLAAAKLQNPDKFSKEIVIESSVDYQPKAKKKKTAKRDAVSYQPSISISLARKESNQASRPVIQRPEDVWLYLKDFNQVGPYSCLLCTDWFLSRGKVVVHYILNHKKDYCGICRYFVKDSPSWQEHLKFHTPHPCSQCNETFLMEEELKLHLSTVHNLVHCRLCHFRVPDDNQYNAHLTQKHNTTNCAAKDNEVLWELEPAGESKFQCLLCMRPNNPNSTFVQHYMGYHHFTLKCLASLISGKGFPFSVFGINLSSEFLESLYSHGKLGYVDLEQKNVNIHETEQSIAENEALRELLLDVKLEALSDHEDADENEGVSESNDTSDYSKIKSYRGQTDFDITSIELVTLEKCFHDYLKQSLTDFNAKVVPPNSGIQYEKLDFRKTDVYCSFCNIQHKLKEFPSHMLRSHGVKAKSIYFCRVCATTFDTRSELDNHIFEEMGDFEDLWLCQFCDKEFDNRQATRAHLTEHWDVIETDNCFSPHLGFKCRYCPILFWNETDRESHHHSHIDKHKEEFYKCECGKIFSDKIWYTYHYFESHYEEDQHFMFKCTLCSLVQSSMDEMRTHFYSEHPGAKKLFCCLDTCKFRPLSHKKSFMIHLKSLHAITGNKIGRDNTNPRLCTICGREFPSARARGIHVAQVHGSAKFKCKMCDQYMHSMDERKLHYLISHPGRHPFECSECGKSFQYKSSLYTHKLDHAPNKQDFTCQYCQKVFAKKDSFREHLQIHYGPRHACSYCPARFVQRSNMLRHERRHTGERPYTCPHCQRTFSDKGACTSHVRTHTREASYACLYCGQTFAQKSKLTYHIRKHTGENLETCSVCSKMFTSLCSLREHMKIHTRASEVTYKCPLCDKTYRDERYMLRHVRSFHTNTNFECPLPGCRKPFNSAVNLRYHVLTHSRVNMFQCKLCPKSSAVKRTMVHHLRRRHGLNGKEINVRDFYTRLDPREANIGLDEETMTRIFGPPKRRVHDVLISDFVTYKDKVNTNKKDTQESSNGSEEENDKSDESDQDEDHIAKTTFVNIKVEPKDDDDDSPKNDGQELEPTDFVSVKIEPMDDDE